MPDDDNPDVLDNNPTPPVEPKEPVKEPKNDNPTPPVDDLAPIKESLNKAYKDRDDARKEAEDLKKKLRDQEIEALKKDGKDREALEAQLSDRDSEIDTLKKQIVELTRDTAVHRELGSLEFRNERARDLAYSTVVKDLVQNADGKWVSKSGKDIEEAVQEFAKDEDNKFLFKEGENRGTKDGPVITAPKTPLPAGNKLKDKSQAEVLKLAREGKLP